MSKETKLDQACRLYEVIGTKEDGYEKLANALVETKQTKAARVILNDCILMAISSSTVNVSGNTRILTDILSKEQIQDCVRSVLQTMPVSDL